MVDTTTEVVRCVECGDELPAERAELGYTYCTKESCQARHYRGLLVTTVGMNKSGDDLIVADAAEIRRRGEAGEFARKDTGLGIDYRQLRGGTAGPRPTPAGGALPRTPTPAGSDASATRPGTAPPQPATPAAQAGTPATPRGTPAPQSRARPAARPWTAEQEKLVRVYHEMGLSPHQIAERARANAPRLGVTASLAVRILSAPSRR